jgi:hypothetical protein
MCCGGSAVSCAFGNGLTYVFEAGHTLNDQKMNVKFLYHSIAASPSPWKEIGFIATTVPSGDCFCELFYLELETKSVTSQGLSFGLKIGILDILPPSSGRLSEGLPTTML